MFLKKSKFKILPESNVVERAVFGTGKESRCEEDCTIWRCALRSESNYRHLGKGGGEQSGTGFS
jgi:hypothetical protein